MTQELVWECGYCGLQRAHLPTGRLACPRCLCQLWDLTPPRPKTATQEGEWPGFWACVVGLALVVFFAAVGFAHLLGLFLKLM